MTIQKQYIMQQTTTTVVRVFGIPVMRKESVTPISEANFKAMLEKTLNNGIDADVKVRGSLKVSTQIDAGGEVTAGWGAKLFSPLP